MIDHENRLRVKKIFEKTLIGSITFLTVASFTAVASLNTANAGAGDFLGGVAVGVLLGGAKNSDSSASSNRSNNSSSRNRARRSGYSSVRRTQESLQVLGFYYGAVNGRNNEETKAAIVSYQQQKGLTPTGSLKGRDLKALYLDAESVKNLAIIGTPDSMSTSTNEHGKRIQIALKALNFYTGRIDGKLGPQSKRSISNYQQSNGLHPTGDIVGNDFRNLIAQGRQALEAQVAGLRARNGLQVANNRGGGFQPQQRNTRGFQQPNNRGNWQNQQPSYRPNNSGLQTAGFSPIEPVNKNATVRRKYDVAVIIGNKTYKEGVPAVAYGHRDADAVKAMIINKFGFSPENVIDLRDAGQGQMRNVFGSESSHKGRLWRYANADGKSNILVYYSGHGAPEISSKRAYLVPVDADPNTLDISGYSLALMYKNLQKIPAKSVTVMLDACFSGDSSSGMLIKSASPLVIATEPKTKNNNFAVLTASSGNELASWDDLKGHGIFTSHMLEGLKGAADQNGDKKITTGELNAYVNDKVRKAARRSHGRDQTTKLVGNKDLVLVENY